MNKLVSTLSVVLLLAAAGAHAQDVPKTDVPATAAPAPIAPRPAPVRTDTIKGNAGRDVAIIAATGDCANGMKAMGITNKNANRPLMAKVDVIVTFSGRMSKKSVLIDNLAAGEVRYIGCAGCVDNLTGKTCTTYKIIAAAYK